MTKKVATIKDLVRAFGGAAELGRWAGVRDTAIHNWVERQEIPPCWHLRLLMEAKRKSIEIDPIVFGFDDDEAAFLRQHNVVGSAFAE